VEQPDQAGDMTGPPHRAISDWTPDDVDRNGLVMLERAECLHLLAEASLGRLGLTSGALPVVLPVNFHFDGERILIRTSPGTKLDAATQDAVVAFEIDDIDPVSHTGWSVIATGLAHHVTDPADLDHIRTLPLPRWAPGGSGEQIVAVRPDILSGRRIEPGAARAALHDDHF
jgi:uncharacterized protein